MGWQAIAFIVPSYMEKIMSNVKSNHDTSIVRNLPDEIDFHRNGLHISEHLHQGSYPYVFSHPVDEHHTCHAKMLEELTKKLLNSTERYPEREVVEVDPVSGDVNIKVFEVDTKDPLILTSAMLGFKIHQIRLGKNIVFLVGSNSEKTYNAGQKILEGGGCWIERIQEVIIGVKNFRFSNFRDEEIAKYDPSEASFYELFPQEIASLLLKSLPTAKPLYFSAHDVLRSFHSSDNLGVPLCELLGSTIFFRFADPQQQDRKPGAESQNWRKATMVRVEGEATILSREHNPVVELIIRSKADRFDRNTDESFDYSVEQSGMRTVGRALYFAMLQHTLTKR